MFRLHKAIINVIREIDGKNIFAE